MGKLRLREKGVDQGHGARPAGRSWGQLWGRLPCPVAETAHLTLPPTVEPPSQALTTAQPAEREPGPRGSAGHRGGWVPVGTGVRLCQFT